MVYFAFLEGELADIGQVHRGKLDCMVCIYGIIFFVFEGVLMAILRLGTCELTRL